MGRILNGASICRNSRSYISLFFFFLVVYFHPRRREEILRSFRTVFYFPTIIFFFFSFREISSFACSPPGAINRLDRGRRVARQQFLHIYTYIFCKNISRLDLNLFFQKLERFWTFLNILVVIEYS